LLGKNLENSKSRIGILKAWWGPRVAEGLAAKDTLAYWSHRQSQKPRGHGGAAVDRELSTLRSALTWAVNSGRLTRHPLPGPLPKFRPAAIRHCREVAPVNADELHQLARFFFELPGLAVLGWQILLEALTGCRTSEVLRLRWDAPPHGPGAVEGDWLWLERSKRGVNPYAMITPALREALRALAAWRDREHPGHLFYLPSPKLAGKPVGADCLTHELPIASQTLFGRRITPHGLRSFYVTARRSQGVSDAQIAAEIGDATGAAIISSTYGAIPPNWAGSTKRLGWLPSKGGPAWEVLKLGRRPRNVIRLKTSPISGL
jgi:integrase